MCVAWMTHQRASTRRVVQQPAHRPSTGGREAFLDLLRLLGGWM
jgi:hypothetical protein